jgi:NAD(P)-dependent dehydrogenase (short-subunit alcohol dehydrogenase family)
MKYEIPEMLKRGRGAMVNNGSAVGLIGASGIVGNVASKHGVSGLTKSAALQYATQGIRANAVAPGIVNTPLLGPGARAAMLSIVPLGHCCEPEEVAEVVVILCSERRLACHRTRDAGRRRLDGALVGRFSQIAGYRWLSLIRAFGVVKYQLALA